MTSHVALIHDLGAGCKTSAEGLESSQQSFES